MRKLLPRHFGPSRVLSSTVVAAALATALAAAPAWADDQHALITVTGESQVSRAPDMATLSIGVMSFAPTAGGALSDNSAAMAAVIERLKAEGVAAKDLQTGGISVNPNWVASNDGSSGQKIDGFTAMNSLNVAVRDLASLGAVIDRVVSEGANTLNGVNFALTDPRPALDEARKAAVADARAKAELLAGAAGVKLGDLVTLTEGGGYAAPTVMFRADAAAAAPVETGEVSYEATVTMSWKIHD